jgi:hypothetical protein
MGFFSFLTSDTKRSIPSYHSKRKPFNFYVVFPDDSVMRCTNYQGYGVFGGIDVFFAAAYLTDVPRSSRLLLVDAVLEAICDEDIDRDKFDAMRERGIDLFYPKSGKPKGVLPRFTEYLKPYSELSDPVDCPHQGFFYD